MLNIRTLFQTKYHFWTVQFNFIPLASVPCTKMSYNKRLIEENKGLNQHYIIAFTLTALSYLHPSYLFLFQRTRSESICGSLCNILCKSALQAVQCEN